MEYRNLGRSGLPVSVLGLGCDNFGHKCDQQQSAAIVQRAMDLGITLFDTADIYGPGGLSEEHLGKALKGRRQDAVIATKFVGPTGSYVGMLHMGTSRRHIMYAVEASLRRLDTDYIDLYQLHFPFPGVPMEETLRALDDLIRQGKVRYLGTSNFAGWQVVDANWIARSHNLTRFISAQNAYNLLDRQIEKELVPACLEHGAGILAYFPLGSGFLTGKYRPGRAKPAGARLANERPTTEYLTGVPDAIVRQVSPELLRWVTPESIFSQQNYELLERLEAFAQARQHTILDLAIAWLAGQPGVASVLVGASRTEQVEQNAQAADWRLTPAEQAEVNEITAGALSLPPVPKVV
ncbi:MAG: aldo/keto reductase [Deltaproteobacteria bacterium]|nr:aldo/keto reductase [Deltaproteobacteria bacterium]